MLLCGLVQESSRIVRKLGKDVVAVPILEHNIHRFMHSLLKINGASLGLTLSLLPRVS